MRIEEKRSIEYSRAMANGEQCISHIIRLAGLLVNVSAAETNMIKHFQCIRSELESMRHECEMLMIGGVMAQTFTEEKGEKKDDNA